MFDQILQLVKDHFNSNNNNDASAVPAGQTDAVSHEVTGSIIDGLKDHLNGGNIGSVLSMFTGGGAPAANPVQGTVSNNLVERLTSKLGLPAGVASTLAASVVPAIMQKFTSKTADPNDNSFDLQNVMDHLSGGKTANVDIKQAAQAVNQGDESNSAFSNLSGMFGGGSSSGMLGNVLNSL